MLKSKQPWRLILNTQDPSYTQKSPPPNWQILGEFELPVGTIADDTVQIRLKELLDLIELQEDFGNRILNSAQKATARILQVDAENKLEHIRFLVFVPSILTSQKQTWGFFTVEKLEDTEEEVVSNECTIEIYLYVEGGALAG